MLDPQQEWKSRSPLNAGVDGTMVDVVGSCDGLGHDTRRPVFQIVIPSSGVAAWSSRQADRSSHQPQRQPSCRQPPPHTNPKLVMSDQLSVQVKVDQGIACLAPEGFLDLQTAPKLEEEIKKLIRRKRYKLVIDCEKLAYISSAGIGVFMGYIDEVRENNGDIVFIQVLADKVRETFDLVNFGELFTIVGTYNEAVGRFSTASETKR